MKQPANNTATVTVARDTRPGGRYGSGGVGGGGAAGSSDGVVGLVTSASQGNPIPRPRRVYWILISEAVRTFFLSAPLPSSLSTPLTMAGLVPEQTASWFSLLTGLAAR